MKKILAALLALTLVIGLCACGAGSGDGTTELAGMPNPIKTVATAEELTAATNISLDAPEGATDVTYSYIEGENATAQVEFTFMDQQFCYRCQETNLLDLGLPTETNETEEFDITQVDDTAFNISGLYYEWTSARPVGVQDRSAVVLMDSTGVGYIAWIDVVPGFLYTLSTEKDADPVTLCMVADKAFVCMQGDS